MALSIPTDDDLKVICNLFRSGKPPVCINGGKRLVAIIQELRKRLIELSDIVGDAGKICGGNAFPHQVQTVAPGQHCQLCQSQAMVRILRPVAEYYAKQFGDELAGAALSELRTDPIANPYAQAQEA